MSKRLGNHYVLGGFIESSQDMDWVFDRTIGRVKHTGKKIEATYSLTAVPHEYSDDVNQARNAAERALKRLEKARENFIEGKGRLNERQYGYLSGLNYAIQTLKEELGRYHGE